MQAWCRINEATRHAVGALIEPRVLLWRIEHSGELRAVGIEEMHFFSLKEPAARLERLRGMFGTTREPT